MWKQTLEKDLKRVVLDLGFVIPDIVLYIPENPKFGDYSSNIPLQLAKQKTGKDYQTSLEIANEILKKLGHPAYLERVEIAGPGFLNFYLKDESLIKGLGFRVKGIEKKNQVKNILVEYAHPNTHKSFHIGHLRNISIGESISRILEFEGHKIFRVTYGGDIGLHVAKALWGVLKLKEDYEKAKKMNLREKAEFLGLAYATGAQAYEKDKKIKGEIDEINKKLYENDPNLKALWEETKKWSIAYFESIYCQVGTEFDAQIWESEVYESGALIVEENLGRVFVKDQGAIIFPGEKYGLHNRVFITSAGYPTYEGKEMGLTQKEMELFPYDSSIHIVANEQESFFEVTTKALELIDPSFTNKKKHLSYGMVNLRSGKMSSRKGEVISAEELIDQVKQAIIKNFPDSNVKKDLKDLDKIAIGAIKFSFLKYSILSDITFDIGQSVSLQGDSGPYLQYSFARTSSLVEKSKKSQLRQGYDGRAKVKSQNYEKKEMEPEEREVLSQLEYFEAFVQDAAFKYSPNIICQYLLNLARAFNLFYERYSILGSKKEEFRLTLAKKVGETLKIGLYLLGIETIEKM